jgi:hypothetical protein
LGLKEGSGVSLLKRFFGNTEDKMIKSLTSDLRPDNWATFYLFYFSQGIGSDVSFRKSNLLVHLFVGNLLSEENTGKILDAVSKMHEMASGEFIHVLTKLSDSDLGRLKSSVGAALNIDQETGKATSTFFQSDKDVKAYVTNLRSQGAVQQN